MGTLLMLFHHPDASRIVGELNEMNRRWRTGSDEGYRQVGKSLGIQPCTKRPAGVVEISFESKKYPGFYPTSNKIHRLNGFLESHRLMPLNEIFGYPSGEPEDWYLVPDWEKSLELIRSVLRHATTGPLQKGYNYRQHLEAFEEMIVWVIGQKDRACYFLQWSW